jgi:hypothetical protein
VLHPFSFHPSSGYVSNLVLRLHPVPFHPSIWFCVYIQVVCLQASMLVQSMGGSIEASMLVQSSSHPWVGVQSDSAFTSRHPWLCNPWVGRRNKKRGSVFTSRHACLCNSWVGPSNKKKGRSRR